MKKNVPRTYFSSDWHFSHENILSFERGNKFKTIQEHDDFIVNTLKSWADKWVPQSTLWFLGDFGNLDYLYVFDFFRHNGHIVNFLFGNHDDLDKVSTIEKYVDHIYYYPVYLSQKLVVSHFPVGVYADTVNIHGHLHGSKLKDANHINVSLAVVDYRPIAQDVTSKAFANIPKFNRSFLYEPWAEDYVFTCPNPNCIYDKENHYIDLSASRAYKKMKESLLC